MPNWRACINLLTAFGYISPSVQLGSQKRPIQLGESSNATARAPPAKRANQAPPPDYSKIGSFAMAVVDSPTHVTIGASKYHKAQVLAKLNLTADQICLPSVLCKKGVAARPFADQIGHESHTSPLHTFSASILSLASACRWKTPLSGLRRETRTRCDASDMKARGARRMPIKGEAGLTNRK